MILAAAEHARDPKHPPPPELIYVVNFRRWGALPRAGGQLDQPAGVLERMWKAWEVYQAFRAYEQRDKLKTAEWKREHPREWALVSWVKGLRNGSDA